MKVLLVDMGSKHNVTGGQSRVVRILYDGLRKRGFSTYYLGYETMYMDGRKRGLVLGRTEKTLNARKSRLSEVGLVRAAYNLAYVSRMKGLGMHRDEILHRIRRINPDIIISNAIADFPLISYFRANGLRFKAVYIDHGSASTTAKRYMSKEGVPLSMGTGRPAVNIAAKRKAFFSFFDMNVALNDRHYHEISKITGKVSLITNGASVKAYRDPATEERLRNKFGIDKDDFVVVYIGRLFERQKNVSTLIKAFKETRENDMKLLIVGDGPSMNKYKELASDDIRIIFSGVMGDRELNSIYNLSNLFVLPSRWEGFALTVLEAAVHSLPMALSKSAYVSDLNDDGKKAIPSFNENDPYELAVLIEKIYSDEGIQSELRRESLRIAKRFTERRMLDKYAKMLERLE
jgi:glycosyltransferase involved in cell wall biosynthesis